MIYIKTNWDIPFYNMALEEYVMTQLPEDEDYVFFYVHRPSVIVGKHQNTIEEINREYVEANNVFVARRLSGGGAVYHDQGNLNYSIITRRQDDSPYDFAKLTIPVISALRELGVRAEQSGRNDLTIDGKKFSGVAQFSSQNRLLHHGTLLFDSNLENLQNALNVKLIKIESKGVKSVRSRVTNISDYLTDSIGIDEFKHSILKHLVNDEKATECQLSEIDKMNIEKSVREKFSTWAWNWGESPPYSLQKIRKFDCGIVDLRLDISQGIIRNMNIYGDFFALKDIKELAEKLFGVEYSKTALKGILDTIDTARYVSGLTNEEFMSLLFD